MKYVIYSFLVLYYLNYISFCTVLYVPTIHSAPIIIAPNSDLHPLSLSFLCMRLLSAALFHAPTVFTAIGVPNTISYTQSSSWTSSGHSNDSKTLNFHLSTPFTNMPEAITYYDMTHRLAAAFPAPTKFELLMPRRFGQGLFKTYERWQEPCEGKKYYMTIDGTAIKHYGKTLLVPVFKYPSHARADSHIYRIAWIKITLAVYSHVLCLSPQEAWEPAGRSGILVHVVTRLGH